MKSTVFIKAKQYRRRFLFFLVALLAITGLVSGTIIAFLSTYDYNKGYRTNWKSKQIVYQIYPRSFFNVNPKHQERKYGTVGDIEGIKTKLQHIKSLHATYIWISPFFSSPMIDGGYDVSDYRKVDPMFGTNKDIIELVKEAEKLDIGIMVDLVMNHTSDEHPWFQWALGNAVQYDESDKDHFGKNIPRSKALPTEKQQKFFMDYYFIRSKKNWNGFPPFDWNSPSRARTGGNPKPWVKIPKKKRRGVIGGDEDYYFFTSYSDRQPDLNWDNELVREEFQSIANFWIEKGIRGFRLDAVNRISKVWDLPINTIDPEGVLFYAGKNFHSYIREFAQKTYKRWERKTKKKFFVISEISGTQNEKKLVAETLKMTSRGDEFDSVFNFQIMRCIIGQNGTGDFYHPHPAPLKKYIGCIRESVNHLQTDMEAQGGSLMLSEGGHDWQRPAQVLFRDGEDKKLFLKANNWAYMRKRAMLVSTIMYFMKGTLHIYQGEEIGMTSNKFDKIENFRDYRTLRFYNIYKKRGIDEATIIKMLNRSTRDNPRILMQWDNSKNAGFCDDCTPWIMKNEENYAEINVADQEKNPKKSGLVFDPQPYSVLNYFRELTRIRSSEETLIKGRFRTIVSSQLLKKKVIAYEREYKGKNITVIANLSSKTTEVLPNEYKIKNLPEIAYQHSIYKNKHRVLLSNYYLTLMVTRRNSLQLRPFQVIAFTN